MSAPLGAPQPFTLPCVGGPLDGGRAEYQGDLLRYYAYPPRVFSATLGVLPSSQEAPDPEQATMHLYLLNTVQKDRYHEQHFYAHESLDPLSARSTMLVRLGWLV